MLNFDLVVAYNVLMDVEDVPTALKEFRRVMRPTGQPIISIVHPLADHGRFVGEDMNPPLSLKGPTSAGNASKAWRNAMACGCIFAGWSQPLETYGIALEEAGFAITSLREPVPDLNYGRNHMAPWLRMSLFLWLKARPLAF